MAENFFVDFDASIITLESGRTLPFDSPEAFSVVSRAWLRLGWDLKYVYGFSWLGRPIIQLPEDVLAIQELIYTHAPDIVIETGVAHGGSLVLYASILEAMGRGQVIGVDVDIRRGNRQAIEKHRLSHRITLVEGDSVQPETVNRVAAMVPSGSRVLVILDSNHSFAHVSGELEAYSSLLEIGDWLVACDGIMESLKGAPRSSDDWDWNNPAHAAREFVARHGNFVLDDAPRGFNEGSILERVTYWPSAYLRRIS